MTVTTQQLTEAFGLFATVIRHPLFRQREIERMKSERLADLLQQRAEPRGLADESFEAHPDYDDAVLDHDIAVIKRAAPITDRTPTLFRPPFLSITTWSP